MKEITEPQAEHKTISIDDSNFVDVKKRSEGKKLKMPKLSPLKQIRKFCIYCCGGYRKSVLFCCDTECPLWYLRLGTKPQSAINRKGKKYEVVFNPENFKEGAKFCPHKEISSFKLGK